MKVSSGKNLTNFVLLRRNKSADHKTQYYETNNMYATSFKTGGVKIRKD